MTGPACAARLRSDSRSGSPERRRSAGVMEANGISSTESISMRAGPTGYRPPAFTFGRRHRRKDTVMSPVITSSRRSRLNCMCRGYDPSCRPAARGPRPD